MRDIVIIGAGVTGCGIARELSKYEYKITVVERASDVCEGTSKANSGIVHAGFDAKPGTLMAKLNVEGNQEMEELSKELDFSFKRNGSIVLCKKEKDRDKLETLYRQGIENGVQNLRVLEREELLAMEPNLSEETVAALYAPTGGIVCPFGLTIALAENAAENGVEFLLNTTVTDIQKSDKGYCVITNRGTLETAVVINAAGVYADCFHNMVSSTKIKIIPRKGEYLLMDKKVGGYVQHTIFQLPNEYGKGVLVTPTVHGNLLAGPTALDSEDKEGINTSAEGLAEVVQKAGFGVNNFPRGQVITSFAGLRAHAVTQTGEKDFILGPVEDAPGFFDAAGIESPGLSCAPSLGKYLATYVLDYLPTQKKEDFKAKRKGIVSMAGADYEVRQKMIAENPLYANVICRCELVTEGEIVDAIHRPLGAVTVDGIKRRTRAGMGRCQSGFCAPKVVEILARELHKDISEITKNDDGSSFLTGFDKDDIS